MLHSWPAVLDRFIFRDTVVNLALYMPFGLAGFLALSSSGRRRLAIAHEGAVKHSFPVKEDRGLHTRLAAPAGATDSHFVSACFRAG